MLSVCHLESLLQQSCRPPISQPDPVISHHTRQTGSTMWTHPPNNEYLSLNRHFLTVQTVSPSLPTSLGVPVLRAEEYFQRKSTSYSPLLITLNLYQTPTMIVFLIFYFSRLLCTGLTSLPLSLSSFSLVHPLSRLPFRLECRAPAWRPV